MSFSESFNTEQLISFLQVQDLGLDNDDYNLLRFEKFNGRSFLLLTQELLLSINMRLGPILNILQLISTLKKGPLPSCGKLDYFWTVPSSLWSKEHFSCWVSNKYLISTRNVNHIFTSAIVLLKNDPSVPTESRRIAQKLYTQKKKVGTCLYFIFSIRLDSFF